MNKFVAILGLVALVAGNPTDMNPPRFDITLGPLMDGRIVGGEETTIDKVPYQVSLQRDGEHYCGGSIIAANWVLTAGHCAKYEIKSMRIHAGSTNVTGGSVHRVQQKITHYDYGFNDDAVMMNDIALLRVAEPFQFDDTRKPIPLFEGNSACLVNMYGMITGWGDMKDGVPINLHKVDVPIISRKNCSNAYHDVGGIPEGEICAGFMQGGKDSCQGDSGGPFSVNGRLVGIVSWGFGCAEPNRPGVYTDVAYFRQWIRQNSGV